MIEFFDINNNKQSFDEKSHFNIAFNADCMEFLRNCPDNAFQLCICDPPYGGANSDIGGGNGSAVGLTNTKKHHLNNFLAPGAVRKKSKPIQEEKLPGF